MFFDNFIFGSCDLIDFDISLFHNFEDGSRFNFPILKPENVSNKSRGWLY